MNMKKIIMVLISMALVFTMAGAVSADELSDTGDASGNAQTIVRVSENVYGTSVLITFPTTIELTGNKDDRLEAFGDITINKAVFSSEYKGFYLLVSSKNNFALLDDTVTNSIPYQMVIETDDGEKIGDPYKEGDAILTITEQVSESSPFTQKYLFETVSIVSEEELIADFTDTLTFTVEYIEAESTT